MPCKFRFGVTLQPSGKSRRAWQEVVRRTAAVGFTTITVTDHFAVGGGVFAPLVSAYEAVPAIRVGSLVINADVWNPALLVREAITTSALTDGHFELGLGAGWDHADYRATGLERRSAFTRVERLAEVVEVLRMALKGQAVDHLGKHYSAHFGPWPADSALPLPLLIGGGSRRILQLAAHEADTVSIHRNLERGVQNSWIREGAGEAPHDRVAERVCWIRAAAGSRFDELELHSLIYRVVVTRDRHRVVERLSTDYRISPEQVEASPHFLVGTETEIASMLIQRRERWGISYMTLISSDSADSFAPIVQTLTGT